MIAYTDGKDTSYFMIYFNSWIELGFGLIYIIFLEYMLNEYCFGVQQQYLFIVIYFLKNK